MDKDISNITPRELRKLHRISPLHEIVVTIVQEGA
jgi:hypothetical protein